MQLSWLEQLICNQQVVGSSPSIGSKKQQYVHLNSEILGRYSSGQRGRTVTPLTMSSQVRILLSPLAYFVRIKNCFSYLYKISTNTDQSVQCESSSVGRASAFQAECRRFEPGLSLSFLFIADVAQGQSVSLVRKRSRVQISSLALLKIKRFHKNYCQFLNSVLLLPNS